MAPKSTADDGGAQTDETCDVCGLALDDAHEQPAGYVELTTDGERLCGACADIRHDRYRGDRKTADELAAETDGEQESDDEGGEERGTVSVHGCSTCSRFAHGSDDQCVECQRKGRKPVNETAL